MQTTGLLRVRLLGFLLCTFSTNALAQNVSCSLSGRVLDPAGATVPSIESALTNIQTGFTWKTITNTDGFFSFASLTTGTFSLDIAEPRYQSHPYTGIEVGARVLVSTGLV